MGNKTGAARNADLKSATSALHLRDKPVCGPLDVDANGTEYICIHNDVGGSLGLDNVVDGGGSRGGVGRRIVVEDVGGSVDSNMNSVGGSEVATVGNGGVGGVDNNIDNSMQQHVTTRTTHNHTYLKSNIHNTSKHHTTGTQQATDQRNNEDDELVDLLQASVRRQGERPAVRANQAGRQWARQYSY